MTSFEDIQTMLAEYQAGGMSMMMESEKEICPGSGHMARVGSILYMFKEKDKKKKKKKPQMEDRETQTPVTSFLQHQQHHHHHRHHQIGGPHSSQMTSTFSCQDHPLPRATSKRRRLRSTQETPPFLPKEEEDEEDEEEEEEDYEPIQICMGLPSPSLSEDSEGYL